jgi:hypothetical protein
MWLDAAKDYAVLPWSTIEKQFKPLKRQQKSAGFYLETAFANLEIK